GADAAGVLGDPVDLPWLVEALARPALARRAGEALATITGVDYRSEGLLAADAEAPDDDEGDDGPGPADDPEDGLPRPAAAAGRRWWAMHQSRFAESCRFLLGQPLSTDRLGAALRHATHP